MKDEMNKPQICRIVLFLSVLLKLPYSCTGCYVKFNKLFFVIYYTGMSAVVEFWSGFLNWKCVTIHMYYTAKKFRFMSMYSKKWNCAAAFLLPYIFTIFMHLWPNYKFPQSVHLFSCSKIGRPFRGINDILFYSIIFYTNRSQIHECRNGERGRAVLFLGIFVLFSVQCLCSTLWRTFKPREKPLDPWGQHPGLIKLNFFIFIFCVPFYNLIGFRIRLRIRLPNLFTDPISVRILTKIRIDNNTVGGKER